MFSRSLARRKNSSYRRPGLPQCNLWSFGHPALASRGSQLPRRYLCGSSPVAFSLPRSGALACGRLDCLPFAPVCVNSSTRLVLAFTRYCHNQYRTVYDIQKGGWGGRRILGNRRATVLQKCGQCRWGGHNMMIDSCTKASK